MPSLLGNIDYLLYFEKDSLPALLGGTRSEGSYRARWFNPRTGAWTAAGSQVLGANTAGQLTLPPFPGDSARAETDWALKLTLTPPR